MMIILIIGLFFFLLGILLILSSDNKPSKDISKEELIKSIGEEKYNKLFDENGKLKQSPNYKPNQCDDFGWYSGG